VVPEVAEELLSGWFPTVRVLVPAPGLASVIVQRLAGAGIAGGAVYDALIGLTAAQHGAELVTRDVRAAATYEALAVPHRVIGG